MKRNYMQNCKSKKKNYNLLKIWITIKIKIYG